MSALFNFHTFEVMDGAVVLNASSETTGHPAEHAIAPLEPNFAWEANESSAQHTLSIDLGETRSCSGIVFRHHETESSTTGISVDVECSSDGTNWSSVSLSSSTSGGPSSPADLKDSSILFKVRYFVNSGTLLLEDAVARYWRFTIKGLSSPYYYAPSDARMSVLWLFTLHQLDRGAAWPMNDNVVYPADSINLAFGKVYKTGYSINPHTPFSHTWMVTTDEYDTLRDVMECCNGTYRPVLITQPDGTNRLCKFASDEITEELLDIDLWRVTLQFVALPIVGKDKYH